jgi:hypothetical protein
MTVLRGILGGATAALLASCVLLTDLDGLSSGAGAGDGSASDAPSTDSATSDSSDSPAPPSTTIAAACKRLADAQCNRFAACSPRDLQLLFGGPVTCSQRLEVGCNALYTLSDIGFDPAKLDTCAGDLAKAACLELTENRTPASCRVAGARPTGARCVDYLQCQSLNCPGPATSVCGTCQPAGQIGEQCTNGCAPGLLCGTTCAEPGGLGASCDVQRICGDAYQCVNGKCIAYAELDEPCSATVACSAPRGFACDNGTMKCAQVAFAQTGQPCGIINGTTTRCAAGNCVNQLCVGTVWIGQACTPGGLPACMFPSQCVAGECVLATDSLCP